MLRWYPGPLLRIALDLTLAPVAFLTVFAIHVLADASTPWTMGPWDGPGATVDFWKLAALLVLGWVIVVLGWRGARRAFKVLALAWHATGALAALYLLLEQPGTTLYGEAVGLRISLTVLAPLYALGTLLCLAAWCLRDNPKAAASRSVSPLQPRHRLAAGTALLGTAAAAAGYALEFDEPATWIALVAMLAAREWIRPLNPSAELQKALLLEGSAFE